MQDLLWIADHIGLDFGNDRGPSIGWVGRGTISQQMNKFTITKISLYCAKNPGVKNTDRPEGDRGDQDYGVGVRLCEIREVAAYKKIVTVNAPQSVKVNCTADNGYFWMQQCIEDGSR